MIELWLASGQEPVRRTDVASIRAMVAGSAPVKGKPLARCVPHP